MQFINLTPTIDLFEVVWQLAFIVAFACSAYNVIDARRYHKNARLVAISRPLVIARKDLKVAWGLWLISFPGLAVGTLALTATTTLSNPNTPIDLLIFSVLLRLAFVSIGVGIAWLAVVETQFRTQVSTWKLMPTAHDPKGHHSSLAREGGDV